MIDNLINELSKTNNSTMNYYLQVEDKLKCLKTEGELRDVLDGFISSSKIKDYGQYSKSQSDAWDKVWEEANRLRDND